LRPYQQAAFDNRTNGVEVWLWGRQTGKSYTLAAWAVDRLITRPGRLVTILSNSLNNGAELNAKCAEIARLYQQSFEQADLSPQPKFECMNYETRITVAGKTGRIKILPANPRTARGFSGDLILDEFAFHENSAAIWEAAEPILSANKDYLCRIASTPNGRHNFFYRLASDPAIPLRKVTRSDAWRQGMPIYHPITRASITPDEARALAQDKRAYDQNYECVFEAENMALLTFELISAAEDSSVGVVCDGEWSEEAKSFLGSTKCEVRGAKWTDDEQNGRNRDGEAARTETSPLPGLALSFRTSNFASRTLYVGVDVGRTQDLTVITVLEKTPALLYVRAMLRLRNLRLPEQQAMLEVACRSPRFAGARIDMTGLGLGLFEYTQRIFGTRVRGVNFAGNLPLSDLRLGTSHLRSNSAFDNRHSAMASAPSVLALRLLQIYEARRIRHPVDPLLREDLRQPERVTSAEGRTSIVASRTAAGHADHFWSLALTLHAAQDQPETYLHVVRGVRPPRIPRDRFV
jgi:phage FluMu gp28-like protein